MTMDYYGAKPRLSIHEQKNRLQNSGFDVTAIKWTGVATATFVTRNGFRGVLFWSTVIFLERAGIVTLDSGTFRSHTTKNRINDALKYVPGPYRYGVFQRKQVWYLHRAATDTLPAYEVLFEDGMEINTRLDTITYPKEDPNK